MKKRNFNLDDDLKKQSVAAANNFESNQSMQPPSFMMQAVSSQSGGNTQDVNLPEHDQHEESNQTEAPENIASIKTNKLFAATRNAHEIFKDMSLFNNVSIIGSKAFGSPGCLFAPNIKSLILSHLGSEMDSLENIEMAHAVSKVMGDHLDQWKAGLQIPGLDWYPLFNGFPGPYAPPMPNIPTPLSLLPSFGEYMLTNKTLMIQEIMGELPHDMRNDANQATVDSYCDLTVNYFEQWLNTTYITNLLGSGPIPSFKPPFVLSGKVMGGKVLPKMGVLN